MKLRQLTQETTYQIDTLNRTYLVTLKTLNNTVNGCPRKEARVTITNSKGDLPRENKEWGTRVYRFATNYRSEKQCANDLVEQLDNEILRNDL